MGNDCLNTIIIKGSTEFLQSFRDALDITEGYIGDAHLDLETHVSLKTSLNVADIDDDAWIITEDSILWGCSGLSECKVFQNTSNKLILRCISSWTPPTLWAKHCLRLWKESQTMLSTKDKIIVAYAEAGMGFYGTAIATVDHYSKKDFSMKGCWKEDVDKDGYTYETVIKGSKLAKFLDRYFIRGYGGVWEDPISL